MSRGLGDVYKRQQQAVPSGIGHRELRRDQFTTASTLVVSQEAGVPVSMSPPSPPAVGSFRLSALMHQSHSRAPFFHAYAKPAARTKTKMSISINPKRPSSRNMDAHGRKKIVSMSNTMNSIATR